MEVVTRVNSKMTKRVVMVNSPIKTTFTIKAAFKMI